MKSNSDSESASAFIIVDLQNDFCEGGSLAVKDSNEIIPLINKIRNDYENKFQIVVLTQDHHPEDHISFNDTQIDPNLELDELTQKWKFAFPRHCVQNTPGCNFHKDLIIKGNETIIKKGENKYKEEFSGFANAKLYDTLASNNIKNLFIVGLAYDFCVGCTALHGVERGFSTFVIKDASRGISHETIVEMDKKLRDAGVKIITSDELINHLL
jgi:nicotinamidase/pyrazinamidase